MASARSSAPASRAECLNQCGLHVNEDHFLPEIIDPATNEALPYGEWGELTFTSLTKEALPVIRYRTGDLSRLVVEPCECGRTTVRMDKISGRTDDMIIVRGVNVFPSQIESVLLQVEGVQPHYLIIGRSRARIDGQPGDLGGGIRGDLFRPVGHPGHPAAPCRARDPGYPGHRSPRQAGGAPQHRAQHGQGKTSH